MSSHFRFALTVLAFACLPAVAQENKRRQTLTPARALTGHWVTDDGDTHYYFGDGKVVMTSELGTQDMKFEVLNEKADEGELRLKVATEKGSHEKTLRFADHRRGLMETVSVPIKDKKIIVNTIWKYVDDKIEPEKKDR